jgi:hypothetical protein
MTKKGTKVGLENSSVYWRETTEREKLLKMEAENY